MRAGCHIATPPPISDVLADRERCALAPGPSYQPPSISAAAELFMRDLDLRLRQLLDVDVLEGHDLDVADEARRTVHVPHPGIGHRHLEVDLPAVGAGLQVDRVGEVEAALGL